MRADMPNIKVSRVPHLMAFGGGGKLSNTPARCNRRSGNIWINESQIGKFTKPERLVILLHEKGHIVHNTSNEYLADKYALEQFVKLGYPLTTAVNTLCKGLSNSDFDRSRIKNILSIAKEIDKVNFLPKQNEMNTYTFADENYTGAENAPENDNFLIGVLAKKLFQGKKAKDAELERKKSKQDAKNEAIKIKALADLELAQQGIKKTNVGDTFTNIAGSYKDLIGSVAPLAAGFLNPAGAASGALGGLFGGGGNNQFGPPPPPRNNNIIFIVLGAVVLIAAVFLIAKKK